MEKGKKTKKEKNNVLKGVIGVCVVVIAIIVVILLCRGESTVTGEYPEDEKSVSLICENTGLDYPVFTYDGSNNKETKVSILFSNDKMKSISLTHTLYYSDERKVEGSEAHNHAAMGKSLAKNGFHIDGLGLKFSKHSDKLVMIMYASGLEFNSASNEYFLVDKSARDELPKNMDDFRKNFENKGFSCSLNS